MLTFDSLKLILLKSKPSIDLEENKDNLFKLIPELEASDGFNQNNVWHIYDILTHIFKVVDGVPAILPLRVAALFHDIGKPYSCIKGDDNQNHYPNHWILSQSIFQKYRELFNLPEEDLRLITNLIYDHDRPLVRNEFYKELYIDRYGKNLELLFMLKEADILASNPIKHDEALKKLNETRDEYYTKIYVNH